MNLRKQLEKYMELRDLRLTELARRSGVSKHTINDWLQGQSPRDVSKVKRVAEVLGTSIDHLCFGSGLDLSAKKAMELEALLGEQWVSGVFEVRLRRLKHP